MTIEFTNNESPQPGRMLVDAREAMGLERAKVAADLMVAESVIEAMEANRFETFGAPVYAKGFLRKYSTMLGLDAATVIAAYEAAQGGRPVEPTHVPVTPAAPVVRMRMARNVRLPPPRTILIAVAVIAVLLSGYRYSGYLSSLVHGAHPAATSAAAPPATTAERAISLPVATGDDANSVGSSLTTSVTTITLRGIRTAWVEIRDVSGSIIFSQQIRAGELHSATGAAPWRVYLGDADGVELSLGAHIVDVPASRRSGSEARFGLQPDGTIL